MTNSLKSHIETLREMFALAANERRMKEADAITAAIESLSRQGGEYDRELIAKMLDELEPVVGLQYIRESVANQARLLRAADNRDAAGVHTGRASEAGDCPDGFVLVRKEAIDWLNGESDFECPPDRYFRGQPPRYWWRSVFREKAGLAIAAALNDKLKLPVKKSHTK